MKLKHFILPLMSASILTSCFDQAYDLSDIDTTTKLQVNDLTIPINLKEIDLDNIIDLDSDDPNAVIRVMEINGEKFYAFQKSGEFSANPVSINKIQAPKPTDVPTISTKISMGSIPVGVRKKNQSENFSFYLPEETEQFTYDVGSQIAIDNSVKSVKNITFDKNHPLVVDITFEAPQIESYISKADIRNLVLILPEGSIGKYGNITSQNGLLTIPEVKSSTSKIRLQVEITFMDFTKNKEFNSTQGAIISNGEFSFTESIGFKSGEFVVYPANSSSVSSIPQEINFRGLFDLSSFGVAEFSGNINYPVEMNSIPDVELNDIPEFLSGAETNILLANPQLFLEANNPVGKYNVGAEAGFTAIPMHESTSGEPQILNSFSIGYPGASDFRVLLCPDPDASSVNPNFQATQSYTFPGMSKLLQGPGIPTSLQINLTSPATPQPVVKGDAVNFPLQQPIAAIDGSYTFYSPLALADGSMIVYSDQMDGWSDDEVDKIDITTLKLSALATTDVPCAIKLIAYPLNKSGERMEIHAEAQIPANCTDYPFTLIFKGDIDDLDGIYFEAIVTDFTGKALSPSQKIHLGNIRATVSGSYTTSF